MFLIIILLFAPAFADLLDLSDSEAWYQFKLKFGKVYPDFYSERNHYNIFLKNRDSVKAHNQKYNEGLVSYYKEINRFSDLPYDYLRYVTFGFYHISHFNVSGKARIHKPDSKSLPESLDWRKKGVVTPVKDQGFCRSCWAFTTTGALEGQHALATGKLVSLSEQNLVDCSKQEGNFGCSGGWPFDSYEYIMKDLQGLNTEASYPYKGVDQTCAYNPSNVGATATAFAILTPDDEIELKEAVANVGPISVCINANENFVNYAGGIYDDSECKSDFDDINHCVLAVGYGHDSATGKDYWIVKNSWNTSWGEEGYIKMVRNKMNQCAISTLASYPIVESTISKI